MWASNRKVVGATDLNRRNITSVYLVRVDQQPSSAPFICCATRCCQMNGLLTIDRRCEEFDGRTRRGCNELQRANPLAASLLAGRGVALQCAAKTDVVATPRPLRGRH